jgi:hypothetical protein
LKPPASPPVALPRLRLCAPTGLQVHHWPRARVPSALEAGKRGA